LGTDQVVDRFFGFRGDEALKDVHGVVFIKFANFRAAVDQRVDAKGLSGCGEFERLKGVFIILDIDWLSEMFKQK
jgi:hypothetical protein